MGWQHKVGGIMASWLAMHKQRSGDDAEWHTHCYVTSKAQSSNRHGDAQTSGLHAINIHTRSWLQLQIINTRSQRALNPCQNQNVSLICSTNPQAATGLIFHSKTPLPKSRHPKHLAGSHALTTRNQIEALNPCLCSVLVCISLVPTTWGPSAPQPKPPRSPFI